MQLLMAEVNALPPMTGERFLALFRSLEGQRLRLARRDVTQAQRLEDAARMLSSGMPRARVNARLVVLYGCSRDAAERVTAQALNRARGPVRG